jgi:predicted RecA/RadA family phage recombinase
MSSNLNVRCETQRIDPISFTAAADGSAGDVVAVGDCIAVLMGNVLNGAAAVGILRAGKIVLAKKSTDSVVPGNILYWDSTAKNLTLTATSNKKCAVALEAAGSGVTSLAVDFNGAM